METGTGTLQPNYKADNLHAAQNSLDNARDSLQQSLGDADALECRVIMDAIKYTSKATREVAFLRKNMR